MRLSKDISNMIMHGVDALSGLIPFWGGLVGALASSAGSAAKHLESTFSYKSIVVGFEQLFALVEKEVTQLVQKNSWGSEAGDDEQSSWQSCVAASAEGLQKGC